MSLQTNLTIYENTTVAKLEMPGMLASEPLKISFFAAEHATPEAAKPNQLIDAMAKEARKAHREGKTRKFPE